MSISCTAPESTSWAVWCIRKTIQTKKDVFQLYLELSCTIFNFSISSLEWVQERLYSLLSEELFSRYNHFFLCLHLLIHYHYFHVKCSNDLHRFVPLLRNLQQWPSVLCTMGQINLIDLYFIDKMGIRFRQL